MINWQTWQTFDKVVRRSRSQVDREFDCLAAVALAATTLFFQKKLTIFGGPTVHQSSIIIEIPPADGFGLFLRRI